MVKKENTKRKKAAAKKPVVGKTKVAKKSTRNKALDSVYKGVRKPSLYDKVKAFVAKNTVLSIVIVFVVIGVIMFGINQAQAFQEKQQFNKAEAALDELANSITDEYGKAVSFEKDKFCAYRSVKFEDPGPPACSVNYTLVYKLSENKIEDLNSIASAVDKSIEGNALIKSDSMLINTLDYTPKYSFDYYSDAMLNIDSVSLDCSVTLLQNDLKDEVDIYLSCLAQDSKAQHFPTKD